MSKEIGSVLERAYVDMVYVLGSWACCKSTIVAATVIGRDARPTQWHRTVTSASAIDSDLKHIGREHGEPPRFKKPKDLPWAVELTTDAISLRNQQASARGEPEPAIAFRPIGDILVAGIISGHKNMGDTIGAGIRYDFDTERPDYGGLEVALGLFDQESKRFYPAFARINVREQIPVSEFSGRPLQ